LAQPIFLLRFAKEKKTVVFQEEVTDIEMGTHHHKPTRYQC